MILLSLLYPVGSFGDGFLVEIFKPERETEKGSGVGYHRYLMLSCRF